MAANPKLTSNKHVIRARNLANQLDRTKCIAGKRLPKDFDGRKPIILLGASLGLVEGSSERKEGLVSEWFDGCSDFMFLVSRLVTTQIQFAIALIDDCVIIRRQENGPRLPSIA